MPGPATQEARGGRMGGGWKPGPRTEAAMASIVQFMWLRIMNTRLHTESLFYTHDRFAFQRAHKARRFTAPRGGQQ